MILVVDNHDSFTFNLVAQLLMEGVEVHVVPQDEIRDSHLYGRWEGILISPGPGRPEDAMGSLAVLDRFLGKVPVLGVCLGHQMLGQICGMKVVHAPAPVHGKTSAVFHDGLGLFEGIPSPMEVMRYHSLLLLEEGILPDGLTVSARTGAGEIMAIHHKFLSFDGVQFHPESVLTEYGQRLIQNWIKAVQANTLASVERQKA